MHLSALFVYPVKSCAPLAQDQAMVEARGLRHDRRWMVVDPDGAFVTGRQCPRLVLLQALPLPQGLRLQAPGLPALEVPAPAADGPVLPVQVWKSQVQALAAGARADAWLSRFLQRPVRLVHMDAQVHRAMTSSHAAGQEVSFADGFPMLLVSQAALEALNARLATPVPMQRFRPNLVVDATAAHAEDGWRRVRIGAVEFEVAKPCTRCVFTTVDHLRGERDPAGEPLRTLIGYRRGPDGVSFGQNLIPCGTGTLRQGDPVQVLD